MKILVTDGIEKEALAKLQSSHQVDAVEMSPEDLLNSIEKYDALIVRGRTKVTAQVIEKGKNLKVVGRAGVGVDNVDVAAATKRKIAVVNAPTGSTISVAELAIGHMISLARRLPAADKSLKAGKWEKKAFMGTELNGKTLGLLGSGRIGTEVAKRAQAFGMKTIAYDPYLPPAIARQNKIELVNKGTVFTESDFLSIHAALTPETKGMVGAQEFDSMKKTAFLVNCARGEVVEEKALVEALKTGKIAGAALDVFEIEPPTGSPLLGLENVFMTPHIGASTYEAQFRAGMTIVEQVDAALRGDKPEFVVNKEIYGG
jgi:D-3-phosphoglycerate dehydrogenase